MERVVCDEIERVSKQRGGHYMINVACEREGQRTSSFHPPISNVKIQGSI